MTRLAAMLLILCLMASLGGLAYGLVLYVGEILSSTFEQPAPTFSAPSSDGQNNVVPAAPAPTFSAPPSGGQNFVAPTAPAAQPAAEVPSAGRNPGIWTLKGVPVKANGKELEDGQPLGCPVIGQTSEKNPDVVCTAPNSAEPAAEKPAAEQPVSGSACGVTAMSDRPDLNWVPTDSVDKYDGIKKLGSFSFRLSDDDLPISISIVGADIRVRCNGQTVYLSGSVAEYYGNCFRVSFMTREWAPCP